MTDRARVGLSLLTLAPGDLGGSETYARCLIRALAEVGTLEYTAFVPEGAQDAANGIRGVAVGELAIARRGPVRIPAIALGARRSRELRAALQTVDVVHYPLTVPIPRAHTPRVLTIHDLQHLDAPGRFSAASRSFRRIAYDRAARRAAAVIVPSAFVQDAVVERLGVPPERVRTIPHGVDHALFGPTGEGRELFLLYPARPWPHKNHGRLLEAFSLLQRELPELRLVLTGGGLEKLGSLPEGVERRGAVSLEELASLYRRAACLVYPSLYEGFGLPVLEAMASGCPVAAARTGAIPELVADAALLFDPESTEAIATGVREALSLADDLRERGLARTAAFTWEATAERHEDVYREVAGS